MPSETTPPLTADALTAMARGFRQSRVLLTGFELDVFTLIADGADTAPAVATLAGTDARATERLLNALVAIGLLEKEDGRFRNAAVAARHLVRGTNGYLAGLGHSAQLFPRWATLTEAVRAGTRIVDTERAPFDSEAFIAAMHHRAAKTADAVIAPIGLDGVRRVIDIGGGSGVFAMAFCRAREDIRAVVLDLPHVVPITRRYIAESGFASRIEAVAGDYLTDDLGSGFDLAFLSAIVHSNGAAENRDLLKRTVAALRPGGRVVIQDWLMDDDRIEPAEGTFFALNMLVNTKAGDSFTETEVRTWLTEAGCGRTERIGTDPRTSFLIGHKEQAPCDS